MPSVTTSMRVFVRDLRSEAHAKAHRVADLFAERLRHALGRRARRKPARLQHDDLAVLRPGLVDQHQRHARGLAGAGRRHQHRGLARAQRLRQRRQRVVDGKGGVEFDHALAVSLQSRIHCLAPQGRGRVRSERSDWRRQPRLCPAFAGERSFDLRPARRRYRQTRASPCPRADRCCADRRSIGFAIAAFSAARSSARNCSHSVTITSTSAPLAQS